MRCLDNRTPDMPRRSFASASTHHQYPSDTEAKQQPQWRIRSTVERSSSAVDIDGFVSMTRRKSGDNTTRVNPTPPIPYQKNSLFSVSILNNFIFFCLQNFYTRSDQMKLLSINYDNAAAKDIFPISWK